MRSPACRARSMSPIGRIAVTVAVLSAVAVSCTSDEDPVETVDATRIKELQIRPVLEAFTLDPNPDAVADESSGQEVLAGQAGETYLVGPAQPENVFSGAVVQQIQGFGLSLTLDGQEGTDAFNALASQCFDKSTTCPTGLIAIVFDGVVLSAPQVNAASFVDEVTVTGRFTQEEVEQLADAINGA